MSNAATHRLALFLCGFVWHGLLSAAVVTIDFEATISSVTSASPANSISANILIGDQFNGTYTYDTAILDSQNSVSSGIFENALTELYINISNKPYYWHLGQYAGKFTGLVETENSAGADRLNIKSTEPTAVVGSPLILDTAPLNPQPLEYLQLQFSSSNFLNSDAMPSILPPVSTNASICLRFDATPLTTACGFGPSDIVIDFTFANLSRIDRFQWANPLPQGNTFLDVTWSDSHEMYVAVGQNGTIATSSNGISWVNRNVLTDERYFSISQNNGTYVAVTTNAIHSSKDNIFWEITDTKVGASDSFSEVIWDGSKFVVVGRRFSSGLLIDTSVDGFSWTQSYPTGEERLSHIATNAGASLYVGLSNSSSSRIVTSTDLQTWTPITILPTKILYSITWGGGQFVAVGASGTILTSSNGLDWAVPATAITDQLGGIKWLNNEFIGVGPNGTILKGSSDGVTWNTFTIPGVSETLLATSYNGSEYITVGGKGTILRSSDTVTWVASSTGAIENFNDSVWTGGEFVAVGNNGSVSTSDNGIDWNFQQLQGSINLHSVATNATEVTNGSGIHVIVGSNGSIYRSTDPKSSWSLVRDASVGNGTVDQLNQVLWVVDQFVAVGAGGLILTSPLGSEWTTQSSSNNVDLKDLTANGNNIVVVGKTSFGGNPVVMTSSDGMSWQSQQVDSTVNVTGLTSVSWSGNNFIATAEIGSAFSLLSSRDGMDWQAYNSNTVYKIIYLRWVGDLFIGLGSLNGRNAILASSDGMTWTPSAAYFSDSPAYGISKSASNLVIVSSGGAINYKTGTYINNFAPFAYAGVDQFVLPGDTITITATVSDSDGPDPIIDAFEQTSGPTIVDTNPDPLIIEFVGSTISDYTFTLIVTDDKGVVSTDDILIKIAPNQAPIAVDAGVDQDVNSGSIVTMIGSGQDPENRALTYSWLQIANTQGTIELSVTLLDADKAETRFTAPQTETDLILSFELTVADDGGLSSTDVINITVASKPPVVKPADTKKGGGALFWMLSLLVLAARRRNFDSGQIL